MSKKKKIKPAKINPAQPQPVIVKVRDKKASLLPWMAVVLAVTAVALSPMLKNSFTNWDDDYYVTINQLLRDPDWKGIFSQAVVGNYHPVTVSTLALNYQLSQLSPFSYLLVNLLLHLANTALVFYFVWKISSKKIWPAMLTALVFGIHPMHVESVAWVAERKDVLYTFFFLLSLLRYWKYLQSGKRSDYWICFLFFILSLLSKPAALVLPLVLLVLDYWKGRTIDKKLIIEKIPFFITSLGFGLLNIKVQSSAIVGSQVYPFWEKLFFACYVIMIYSIRFIYPQPLSAFHPFPDMNNLGLPVLLSPIFMIALFAVLWYFRKNKLVVFGLLFFVLNLVLVLQIISIGNTIVSERYTYVPYIGLGFLFSMLFNERLNQFRGRLGWVTFGVIAVLFGFITFQRTQVWKNSGTLWTDVIKQYKDAPLPHSSRADFLFKSALIPANASQKDSLFKLALEDCAIAIKNNPKIFSTYRTRALIYLQQNRGREAITDVNTLINLSAEYSAEYANAFLMRGTAYMQLAQHDKAIADFTTCLSMNPNNDNALVNRGVSLYNLKQYDQALNDFNKAISINPLGSYYVNRSSCYYMLGNMEKAKADALTAVQKGTPVPESYKSTLQLK